MNLVIPFLALTVAVLFLLGVFYSPYLWQAPRSPEAEARDLKIRQAKRARRLEGEA